MLVPEKDWSPVMFIEGDVASSKNSRVNFYGFNKKTGQKSMTSLPSKFARKYMQSCVIQLIEKRKLWYMAKDRVKPDPKLPLEVGLYFFRRTKGRWDYTNMTQAIADCMVRTYYIQDDSVEFFKPVYLGYEKSKGTPGVQLYL